MSSLVSFLIRSVLSLSLLNLLVHRSWVFLVDLKPYVSLEAVDVLGLRKK